MAVAFTPGQALGRGDLDIFLTNSDGNAANAYSISFALYYVDPATQAEVLVGPASHTPVNPSVGEYYAAILVPLNAQPGTYRIRWTFQQYAGDPAQLVVQEWAVVAPGTNTGSSTSQYSTCTQDLIRKLRFLVRDHAPDRHYRFRPPEGEGQVGCYNRVFGYIWEDEELAEYLEIALWKWNVHPPATEELGTIDQLCQSKPAWKSALLWGALVNAAQALAYNWIVDEFSVAGDTLVRVVLPDGEVVDLPIEDLYGACQEGGIDTRGLRAALFQGELRVAAVDPVDGRVGLYAVKSIMQHHTADRPSVCMETPEGHVTTTCDHSLFYRKGEGLVPVRGDQVAVGDSLALVTDQGLQATQVDALTVGPPLEVSYDLCVPGPENFVLSNGIVAHNSYSIGGISLDIEKSSKYMDLKRNAEEQWDKLVESKKLTTLYIRGIQQPRFGIGVRSAFGPSLGRNVLSPRRFM